MALTVLRSERRYSGRIIDLRVDEVRYPSGNESIREVVEHPGGAVIVCLFDNTDILLVTQYRHPFGHVVTELPAGKLDRGEDPLEAAKRELREETGYAADSWQKMTALYATPGFCNEVLHLYLARGIRRDPAGQALEEGEASITVSRVPLAEAAAMIDRQEIVDGKTIAGILLTERILRTVP